MKLAPSDHIVWSIIRLAMVLTSLSIILLFTASDFDETELRTIILSFFAFAGSEGVVKTLLSKRD